MEEIHHGLGILEHHLILTIKNIKPTITSKEDNNTHLYYQVVQSSGMLIESYLPIVLSVTEQLNRLGQVQCNQLYQLPSIHQVPATLQQHQEAMKEILVSIKSETLFHYIMTIVLIQMMDTQRLLENRQLIIIDSIIDSKFQ